MIALFFSRTADFTLIRQRFDSFYILIIFIKCHLFRAIDFGRKSIEPLISVENQSNGTFRHRKCNEHASSWSLNDPQLVHGAQNCVFYAKCSFFRYFTKNHVKNEQFKAPNRTRYPFQARFTRFRPCKSQNNATITSFSTIYFRSKYLRLPYPFDG